MDKKKALSSWVERLHSYDLLLWRRLKIGASPDGTLKLNGIHISPRLITAVARASDEALVTMASGSHLSFVPVHRSVDNLKKILDASPMYVPLSLQCFAPTYWHLMARMSDWQPVQTASSFGVPIPVAEFIGECSHRELNQLAAMTNMTPRGNERTMAKELDEYSSAPATCHYYLSRIHRAARYISGEVFSEWENKQ